MCDTILASPDTTAQLAMLFGKNSDRQRNEAQLVEHVPAVDYVSGTQLKCTYISIPQVARTHAAFFSRPFWTWGVEMGANECCVAIGNEGVQARSPAPEEGALTGLDLVRLGLERAATAAQAVEVMTDLLKQYGQGGNCGHLTPAYYNNSFMIADATDAFVLETVGCEWVLERVRGVRSISNTYSIGGSAERISAGLPAVIRDFGWNGNTSCSYADVIADPQSQHIGHSGARRARSTSLLSSQIGCLGVANMMSILRDHEVAEQSHGRWHPQKEVKRTLCLHACTEDFPSQTTGSMISELRTADSVHWVTGTAAPCLSIFKPLLMDVPLPSLGPPPTDRYDVRSLWWRHERLHRMALTGNFGELLDDIALERDVLESSFRARVRAVLSGGNASARAFVIEQCWQDAIEMEDRWFARLEQGVSRDVSPYGATWARMNEMAGMDACLWERENA